VVHFKTAPTDKIILISSRGRAWRGALGRIPDQIPVKDFGLERGESIVGGSVLKEDGFLCILASNGKAKRTAVSDLAGVEGHWNQVMGGLNGVQVLSARITKGDSELMLFTRQGKGIRFREEQINPQASGSATGVAAMKLTKGDEILGAAVFEPGADCWVLVVSQAGWLKRVPLSEFPVQGRGGGGVQILKTTKTTGLVAAASISWEAGRTNVLSQRNKRHHMKVVDVPVANRGNRGEQLIDFGEDDPIAAVVAFDP
jgi:DNA gyrase subunit A